MRLPVRLSFLICIGCTSTEVVGPSDDLPDTLDPELASASGHKRRRPVVAPVLPTPDAAPIVTTPDAAPEVVPAPDAGAAVVPVPDAAPASPFTYELELLPMRVTVRDADDGEWVATFTYNARTVRHRGVERTFSEATAPHPVIHGTYVRVLPAPFDGVVDEAWLLAQLVSTEPDVLAIGMQYLAGAPVVMAGGLQIAGDAQYGPLVDGQRQEGSDFMDYLGIDWIYADGAEDLNEAFQLGSLDCSGYIRMIWGYRHGIPMVGNHDGGGTAIPRRAVQIAQSAPGVVTIPEVIGVTPAWTALEIGDLVFFDAATDDGTDIDHAGMYLGVDTNGRPRFLSSRKSINGPTMGDYNGASCLDGSGLYATTFRAARRI